MGISRENHHLRASSGEAPHLKRSARRWAATMSAHPSPGGFSNCDGLSLEAGQESSVLAGGWVYICGMANRTYKIGHNREQVSLLPPCLEDYVGADNPVRAIDGYVGSLELIGLAFGDVGSDGGAGQPPYDPADLLKLYLYGYLNQVRSSRRLEREARRNVELMWLLRGLTPGYRTIADFRKNNAAGLQAANRGFVRLARSLDLLGGALLAIDGAFFHGDASKASILTKKRLDEQMSRLDRSIAEYAAALDANDQAEEAAAAPSGQEMAQRLAGLRERRAASEADLADLQESGDGQLSRTDPDARLLAKHGQIVAGYNVQIAVDDKNKLIVASEVVNDGNDTGQLQAIAAAAKEALGGAALTVVADSGYYNGATLKGCEDAGITVYVSPPDRSHRLKAQGRFGLADFRYKRPRPTSTTVQAARSCGRCAAASVRPAARWRSATPVGARRAGNAHCGRAVWPAKARGARSNAGLMRTWPNGTGPACVLPART